MLSNIHIRIIMEQTISTYPLMHLNMEPFIRVLDTRVLNIDQNAQIGSYSRRLNIIIPAPGFLQTNQTSLGLSFVRD